MRLQKVVIKNFKSIRQISFDFPESGMLILVGENNSGKSNIIRAIDAVCGESWYGREKLEDRDFFNRDRHNQIEINLFFDNHRSIRFRPTYSDWGVQYFANWQQTQRMAFGSQHKEDFPSTYLGADRTLDKHLSFYDWTLIGRIRKAFHRKVDEQTKKELEDKFEDLVDIFEKVPGFENFKKDFSKFYDELSPYSKSKIKLDFKPFSPANYFKTLQILATSQDLKNVMDIEEMGEGARNIILLSLLRSYAKNFKGNDVSGILALEEPELFLHPQARRHLFFILREIANSGIQVIVSTHSSSFIDTEFFYEIGRVIKLPSLIDGLDETELVLCSKEKLVDHCKKSGVPQQKVDTVNILEFYKTTSNPRLNEGFFAKCLILVEGETEEICVPELLKHSEIGCDGLGISIIPVSGKNQIPKYWRLYSAFEIPIIVIIDNDNNANKQKSNQNIATCFDIDLEELLNLEECSKIVFSKTLPKTPIVVLKKDFESCLKEEIGDVLYEELELEARKIIKPVGNQQKGVIARYIIRRLMADNPGYVPHFIKHLIPLLKEYLPPIESEQKMFIEEVVDGIAATKPSKN